MKSMSDRNRSLIGPAGRRFSFLVMRLSVSVTSHDRANIPHFSNIKFLDNCNTTKVLTLIIGPVFAPDHASKKLPDRRYHCCGCYAATPVLWDTGGSSSWIRLVFDQTLLCSTHGSDGRRQSLQSLSMGVVALPMTSGYIFIPSVEENGFLVMLYY